MDSGQLQRGETFEHDYDVLVPITGEHVIWIMDELLCLEVFLLILSHDLPDDILRLRGFKAIPSHRHCLRPYTLTACCGQSLRHWLKPNLLGEHTSLIHCH